MKFRKRELWLLVVPLLAIAVLSAFQFVPGLKQNYDDQRLYGDVRPRLILRGLTPPYRESNGRVLDTSMYPVAFSHNGKLIVSADGSLYSKTIRIWNAHTGKLLHSWPENRRLVVEIAFDHQNRVVLYCDSKRSGPWGVGRIEVCDRQTGRVLGTLPSTTSVFRDMKWKTTDLDDDSGPRVPKLPLSVTIKQKELFPKRKHDNERDIRSFHVTGTLQIPRTPTQKPHGIEILKHDVSLGRYGKPNFRYGASATDKFAYVLIRRDLYSLGSSQLVEHPNLSVLPSDTVWLICINLMRNRLEWSQRITTEDIKRNTPEPDWVDSPYYTIIARISPDASLLAVRYPASIRSHPSRDIVDLRSARSGKILKTFQSAPSSNGENAREMEFSPDSRTLLVPCDDRLELWDVSNLP